MSDLDELRRLAEAATPGPWELGWEDDNGWVAFVDAAGERSARERHIVTSRHANDDYADADAAFIAASRTAVPDLLAEVAALREQVAAVREAITEEHAPWNYTEFGVECMCGEPMTGEVCPTTKPLLDALDGAAQTPHDREST